MAIKKQEFYEGAALCALVKQVGVCRVEYSEPFFVLNDNLWCYLKYCTKTRSPWAFSFSAEEQNLLGIAARKAKVVIGMVCAGDGIAALQYKAFASIASARQSAIHVGCARKHREHYQVSGPDGVLQMKIAPSDWQRIIERKNEREAVS